MTFIIVKTVSVQRITTKLNGISLNFNFSSSKSEQAVAEKCHINPNHICPLNIIFKTKNHAIEIKYLVQLLNVPTTIRLQNRLKFAVCSVK